MPDNMFADLADSAPPGLAQPQVATMDTSNVPTSQPAPGGNMFADLAAGQLKSSATTTDANSGTTATTPDVTPDNSAADPPAINIPYTKGQMPALKFNAPADVKPIAPNLKSEDRKFENRDDNMAANAMKDVGDIIRGGGALANAAALRAIQAAPKQAQAIGIPGEGKALFGSVMQQGMADPDAATLAALGGGMFDYYKNTYAKPALQMMTGKPEGARQLIDQYIAHPVTSTLDLGGGGIVKGIGEGAPIAARAAKGAAFKVGGRAGVRAFNKVADFPLHNMFDPVRKTLDEVKNRKHVIQLFQNKLGGAHKEYLDWLNTITKELDQAHKHIPKELKGRLTAAMELIDDEAVSRLGDSKVAQNFVNKVREFDKGWTKRAIDAGLLTQEQVDFNRYAGPWLAEMKKAGITQTFEDLAKDPESVREVLEYAEAMKAQGKEPIWMTIREARKVQDFLSNGASLPLGAQLEDVSFTIDRLKSRIYTDAEGNFSLRPHKGPFETDAARVAKDGLLRTIRAVMIKEAVEELISNPLFKQKHAGWVEVEVDKIFGKAATDAGTKIHPLMGELAKTIYMPAEWKATLDLVMNHKPVNGLLWTWLIKKPSQLKAKVLLGTDPLRVPTQWLQNAAIFGYTQINKPQDVLTGYLGTALALNPKIRAWVPGRIYTGQKAIAATERMSEHLPKWMIVLTGADKLLKMHLELVEKGDNFWRAATAIKLACDEVLKLPDREQSLLGSSLKLSADATRNLKAILTDSEKADAFLKEINKKLGDYNADLNAGETLLADNIMFYRWLRHAFTLTTSVPFDNPIKTAALNSFGTVSQSLLQSGPMTARMKDAGAVSVRDDKGNLKLGPNGVPLVYLKGKALTPFLQTPENVRQLMKVALDGDTDMSGLGLAPFWEILDGTVFGEKLSTGKAFKDPNRLKVGDFQVNMDVAKNYVEGGPTPPKDAFLEKPRPAIGAQISRSIFPKQYDGLSKIYEGNQKEPGKPSDFTVPFINSAPLRNMQGEKKKPMPYNLGTEVFSRLQPTEPGLDEETENSIQDYNNRKLRKNYALKHRGG